jgi:hypothetical protein
MTTGGESQKTQIIHDNISNIITLYDKRSHRFLKNGADVEKYTRPDFNRWLSKNKRSSKLFSRKMCKRIEAKKFRIHVSPRSSYIFYKIIVTKKHCQCKAAVINYTSTSRGTLYFIDISSQGNNILAMTSHFLDRYSSRYLNDMPRLDVIDSFTDALYHKDTHLVMYVGGEFSLYTEDGLFLGNNAFFSDSEEEDAPTREIFSFQTYISNDMLNEKQKNDRMLDPDIRYTNKVVIKNLFRYVED